MTHVFVKKLVLVTAAVVALVVVSTGVMPPGHVTRAAADTVRPVILTTDAELSRSIERVTNHEEPFYSSWLKVKAAADLALTTTFTPAQKSNHGEYFELANSHAMTSRDLALAFRISGNSAYALKGVQLLTAWANDANNSATPPSSGSLAGAGLVVGRVMVPFADAYALLYTEMTATQIASMREWFTDSADIILQSKEFWRTGTEICDYGAACTEYTAPWLGNQPFSNHLSAQNMGLMAIGYALGDSDLVTYSLDDTSNPVSFDKLIQGVILMDTTDAWQSDPTNTLGWADVEEGEIYDRFRAGEYKGLHYTSINLRFLALQADMAANNGDSTDWFAFEGDDGENIRLPFEYYAQFLMTGDNTTASGYYAGSGVEFSLLPLYEIAHREYPASDTITQVLESFDRVAYDAETFGWSLVLTDGSDDVAAATQPYPDRTESSWAFSAQKYFRGWTPTNAATSIADSTLRFTLSHADPRIVSRISLGLPTDNYSTFEFRMRNGAIPGSGALAGNYAQLFFITDTDRAWNESKSIKIPTTMDAANFHNYSVNLAALTSWAGRIYQIRFDPTQGPSSGTVDLEYLRLVE
jgi:hypothetical protein